VAFDVYVVDAEDRPVGNVRVTLEFAPIAGHSASEYTDEQGHVEFDGYDDGEIVVYVNGTTYGSYEYVDGEGITIQY
jgi:hypothetical protein